MRYQRLKKNYLLFWLTLQMRKDGVSEHRCHLCCCDVEWILQLKKAVKSLCCPGVVEPHTDVLLVCTAELLGFQSLFIAVLTHTPSHSSLSLCVSLPLSHPSLTYPVSISIFHPSLINECILSCYFMELHSISHSYDK